MIKTMLLSSVLLTTAVLAVDARAAGPCSHIRNHFDCNANPECFWDDDDDRCEQRGPIGGLCSSIVSHFSCNANPHCFWDDDDDRCETR